MKPKLTKNFLTLRGFQIYAYFFSSFSGCRDFSNVVIFHKIKVQNNDISETNAATWGLYHKTYYGRNLWISY